MPRIVLPVIIFLIEGQKILGFFFFAAEETKPVFADVFTAS